MKWNDPTVSSQPRFFTPHFYHKKQSIRHSVIKWKWWIATEIKSILVRSLITNKLPTVGQFKGPEYLKLTKHILTSICAMMTLLKPQAEPSYGLKDIHDHKIWPALYGWTSSACECLLLVNEAAAAIYLNHFIKLKHRPHLILHSGPLKFRSRL